MYYIFLHERLFTNHPIICFILQKTAQIYIYIFVFISRDPRALNFKKLFKSDFNYLFIIDQGNVIIIVSNYQT